MIYSYDFANHQFADLIGSGDDLTALAVKLSAILSDCASDATVKIYDEPGNVRAYVRAGDWSLR